LQVAILVFLMPAVGAAQDTQLDQDPARNPAEDRQETPREKVQKPGPAGLRQERPEMVVKEEDMTTVKVAKFKISGNTLVKSEELAPVVQEREGQELTLKQIKQVADAVTVAYRARGFGLAFCYVPEQQIKEGVVELVVVETKLDKILVEGNDYFSSGFIQGHFEGLAGQQAVDWDLVERGLLRLNEYPGLKATGVLRPGSAPGTTDLAIQAEDRFPLLFSVDYDNFGTRSVTRHRFGQNLTVTNLWDVGHSLTVRNVIGDDPSDLWFLRASYTAVIGDGFKVTPYYAHYQYDASGAGLSVLDPNGDGDVWGINASYPVILTRQLRVEPDIGLEFKDLEQKLLGVTTGEDDLSILYMGGRVEYTDEFDGRTIGAFHWRQGLGRFLGGMGHDASGASRDGADGDFTLLTLDLYRYQHVCSWLNVLLAIRGQYAANELVVSEQFNLGGPDSVRGYPNFQYLGDSGYTVTLEPRLRLPFLDGIPDPIVEGRTMADNLQPVFFFDYGRAFLRSPEFGESDSEELAGAGVGLRFSFADRLNLRFDVGWPLTSEDSTTGQEPIYYLAVSFRIH
jgi:hemolysin activation/secretion protein